MVDGRNMFPFENLETWQKAIDFADLVYRLTRTIGLRQGFLTEDEYRALYSAAETQGKLLSGLRRSLLR